MLRNLLYLLPGIGRYHLLLKRLHDLEIIQNTLLFDDRWADDSSKYMNGQKYRQSIVLELRERLNFSLIIETGSFIGNTTGWFAKLWYSAVVHSCEIDPRFHELAKIRCTDTNIKFFMGDSRAFLTSLPYPDDSEVAFFYLDAHWSNDLPLREELDIIIQKWPKSVVMIDDFEVPRDQGYAYDSYGKGKALSFHDFHGFFLDNKFAAYSPSLRSSDETGFRRGMVILAIDHSLVSVLDSIPLLSRSL